MDKIEVNHLFDELVEHIESAPWFTEDWRMSRDGSYMHVTKTNWYDDNGQGVHFEVYVGDTEIEAKQFPILMHAETDVPNWEQFVNRMRIALQYEIPSFMRETDEYTILKEMHPLDKETFVKEVVDALTELQFVVPFVDMCLSENNDVEEKLDE